MIFDWRTGAVLAALVVAGIVVRVVRGPGTPSEPPREVAPDAAPDEEGRDG